MWQCKEVLKRSYSCQISCLHTTGVIYTTNRDMSRQKIMFPRFTQETFYLGLLVIKGEYTPKTSSWPATNVPWNGGIIYHTKNKRSYIRRSLLPDLVSILRCSMSCSSRGTASTSMSRSTGISATSGGSPLSSPSPLHGKQSHHHRWQSHTHKHTILTWLLWRMFLW